MLAFLAGIIFKRKKKVKEKEIKVRKGKNSNIADTNNLSI
jgi:hypothetical protein